MSVSSGFMQQEDRKQATPWMMTFGCVRGGHSLHGLPNSGATGARCRGPDVNRYAVSLEAWRDADPQDTYIKVFYTRISSIGGPVRSAK
jgi:hypothetical protein